MTGARAPVGVVLAGGRSRRMGRDKALLDLGGETLAARAVRLVAGACPEVAIAAAGRELVPGIAPLADGPGQGPAAGILGAALAYPGHPLLVVACDLPALPPELLASLARPIPGDDSDWRLPRWSEGVEPLCALYRPGILALLAEQVARGEMALHALETSGARIRYLEEVDLRPFGDPAELFRNLNRPEDLDRWEREASGRLRA